MRDSTTPAALGSLYGDGQAPAGNELGSFQPSSLFIDLTQALPASGIGQATYDIHGEWLYVDVASVGALSADLWKRGDDSAAVTLCPGRAFQLAFDRLTIFGSGAQAPQFTLAGTGILPSPGMTLFYGLGKCPFEPSDHEQSTQPVVYRGSLSASASQVSATSVAVPQGARITASVSAKQVTAAAETSLLRCFLLLTFVGGAVIRVAPDFQANSDVLVAGVGTATVEARWAKVPIPLGVVTAALEVDNVGTAATNNIVALIGGDNPGVIMVG